MQSLVLPIRIVHATLILFVLVSCTQAGPLRTTGIVRGEQIFFYTPPEKYSAFIKDPPRVVVGVPYSGTGITEYVSLLKPLSDQVLRETRKLGHARDRRGRTRVAELTSAGVSPSQGVIWIDDPVRGERYRLQRDDNTFQVFQMLPNSAAGDELRGPAPMPGPTEATAADFLKGAGNVAQRTSGPAVSKTISLGNKTIAGVAATGSRIECIIPATPQPVQLTTEQWFSPELDVVLEVSTDLRVTADVYIQSKYRLEFERGEPDPALFDIPDGFKQQKLLEQ